MNEIFRFEVWNEFFIIWENSKIEKYVINWFYTHTIKNEETQEDQTKIYYVYEKEIINNNTWEKLNQVMTIWEKFMYNDLESVKAEAIRLLDQEVEKIETIRKDILKTNF